MPTKTEILARVRTHLAPNMPMTDEELAPSLDAALAMFSQRFQRRAWGTLTLVDGLWQLSSLSGWTHGVSTVLAVEYPVGDTPRSILHPSEWLMEPDDDVDMLMFWTVTPETVRVRYTLPFAFDGSGSTTLTTTQAEAVALLVAAEVLDEWARRWMQKASLTVAGQDYLGPNPESARRLAADTREDAWRVVRLPAMSLGGDPGDVSHRVV
jgi:hypothetical protein